MSAATRLDLEIREGFLEGEKEHWIIEMNGDHRTEHGPFKTFMEAMKYIRQRKLENK